MLDTDTKRRIDTARDILVGKVPDPKSQVEQITIALIYKFMDDMDAEAEELGGKRKFFAGEFARYGWAKLLQKGLGGHEALALYSDGISRMPENPGVPALFRDIFKNAYLPYRDPETLKAFLKIIDEFKYDHSERLGDAFEYLLSVLGSQGDAGQFRTPRHIIDFLVQVINPQKNETILDPACGTAGFLISAWKHIQAQNQSNGHSTLTPDERGRLARNIKGYDISPDMVRLSLANLYLHGFTDPHVVEYDTLTSEERWNEYADVILANPPFMSPKGGIKPHKRFSVQSKRSEVLFVDYMAEHLTPNGRAGIIVPQGIIFQSQGSYKELRKMLVENSLVAVISLPAGVFQPYSGVKTSILVLDRSIAKQSDSVAFFNVENDGFSLSSQRRSVEKNDLPTVRSEIAEFFRRLRARVSLDDFSPTTGQIVSKEKIAEHGEYNLSPERYRGEAASLSGFGTTCIRDASSFISKGTTPTSVGFDFTETGVNFVKIEAITPSGFVLRNKLAHITDEANAALSRSQLKEGDVLFSIAGAMGRSAVVEADILPANTNQALAIIRPNPDLLASKYLSHLLRTRQILDHVNSVKVGVAQYNVSLQQVGDIEIPLPPLDVQKEIVAEIEGYQKIIDGARQVVDNYRPHIAIDPEWPTVALNGILSFKNGLNFTKAESGHLIKIVGVSDFQSNTFAQLESLDELPLDSFPGEEYLLKQGDILFVRSNGNPELVGRSMIMPTLTTPTTFSGFTIRGRVHEPIALPIFLAYYFKSRHFSDLMKTVGQGANIRNLSQGILNQLEISLPPLDVQQAIVTEIEAEQALVDANKELIARFEKKIQDVLDRVWGSNPVDEGEA